MSKNFIFAAAQEMLNQVQLDGCAFRMTMFRVTLFKMTNEMPGTK